LMIACVSLVFVGNFSTVATAAPQTLKYASAYDVTNAMTSTSRWFISELEKRTNNAYKVELYYSGMMGKPQDLPNLCANGTVDFIFTGAGYTPNLLRLSRGFELMYLTENPHAQDAALWEMYHSYAPLRDEYEKNGLMIGFSNGCGNMAVQCKDPLRNLADMKGLKVRSYAAVGKLISMWNGIPVSINYSEVYEALNRGVIKGSFGIPYVNVYDQKWWEVAPYIVDTGIGVYGLTYFAISKKTYESFPPDVKKVIDQLREDANAHHRQWMDSFGKEATKKIFDQKNVYLTSWTSEEKAKAKAMVTPVIWEDWLSEMKNNGLPGEEFLDIYKKLIKKYESQYPYESPYEYFKTLK
jgi:TRAP-type C4-dicarboxylate transport system substrate-binding protein